MATDSDLAVHVPSVTEIRVIRAIRGFPDSRETSFWVHEIRLVETTDGFPPPVPERKRLAMTRFMRSAR